MKFILLIFCVLIFNSNLYAQNNAPNKTPNIMEVILFLNANLLPEGAASFKADRDKKMVQYFDKEGRLFEQNYIDENNDIVSRNYDKNGGIISETKITKQSVMGMADQAQNDQEERVVPIIKSTLQSLSDAAEAYAKTHNNKYPSEMKDLNIPCTCDQNVQMYNIWCKLDEYNYQFVAKSLWPQHESYFVSTGGVWEIKKPGELSRNSFTKSISPCSESDK